MFQFVILGLSGSGLQKRWDYMFEPLPEESISGVQILLLPRPVWPVEVAGFTKVGALDVMSAGESCMRPERSRHE